MNTRHQMLVRTTDVVLGVSIFFLIMPLLIILYLLCQLDGTPFVVQERVGLDEKKFKLIKFRTMKLDTPLMPTHKVPPNSVTSLGYVLRKYKLDELPQVLNIISGEMSFVGPRPCLATQVEVIAQRRSRAIFSVKPGLTGKSQLAGVDMSTPHLLAKMDEELINQLNYFSYLNYIIKTVVKVLKS